MTEFLQGSLYTRSRALWLARRLSWIFVEAYDSVKYTWAQLSMSCWLSLYALIKNGMLVVREVNTLVTAVDSHLYCIAHHLAGTQVYRYSARLTLHRNQSLYTLRLRSKGMTPAAPSLVCWSPLGAPLPGNVQFSIFWRAVLMERALDSTKV